MEAAAGPLEDCCIGMFLREAGAELGSTEGAASPSPVLAMQYSAPAHIQAFSQIHKGSLTVWLK